MLGTDFLGEAFHRFSLLARHRCACAITACASVGRPREVRDESFMTHLFYARSGCGQGGIIFVGQRDRMRH